MNNCRKIEYIPKDKEEIKTDDNKIIENSYNEKDNESSPEIVKPQISHSIDNIGLFFRIAPLEDDDETFFFILHRPHGEHSVCWDRTSQMNVSRDNTENV
jgi:hypothetical protein